MIPKAPVLDLFIGRHGDAWRLYVAPTSWKPGLIRNRMDERGEIFPVARPDVDDLDRFMWNVDSPFDATPVPATPSRLSAGRKRLEQRSGRFRWRRSTFPGRVRQGVAADTSRLPPRAHVDAHESRQRSSQHRVRNEHNALPTIKPIRSRTLMSGRAQ